MAGHSHWAGIKYKKAANDAKRGKMWSKISRMIIVSAKAGGGDPAANLALRYAIDKAKAANMPKDTIEKAIKKGTGELGAVQYEAVLYEGYAPGGVAVMADGLTDNRAAHRPRNQEGLRTPRRLARCKRLRRVDVQQEGPHHRQDRRHRRR